MIERSARSLYVGLVSLLPFAVLPSGIADDTDVLPKVLVARAVVLLVALLVLLRMVVLRRIDVHRSPLDLPVLALVASAVLSTVLSVNPTLSLFGAYTRYEGVVTVVTYAAIFWIGVQLITTRTQARWLLRAMLAGAAVECAIACAQALTTTLAGDLTALGESAFTFGGVARAFGTMANPNVLAIWLALLLPVAFYEMFTAGALWGRVVAALTVLLMTATLAITFGRSAWIGAALGVAVAGLLLVRRFALRRIVIGIAACVVFGGLAAAGTLATAHALHVPLATSILQRLGSLADPTAGSAGARLHNYHDTLLLVSQRPLVGYGPDTFGLVYPSHTTGDWNPGIVVDKAHSDILQTAATQGLLGVAASVWLLVTTAVMLLRARTKIGVAAVAGALTAYEASILLNFAWFPMTAPFWAVLATAVAFSGGERLITRPLALPSVARAATVTVATTLAALGIAVLGVRPALANVEYAQALRSWGSGDRAAALLSVQAARNDDGAQCEYAALQGDVENDLAGERPGPHADLVAARRAYETALAEGDMYPIVAIRLAYVDTALGDRAGALSAARAARELDPYGPAVKLVAELGG